jgi:hypothetical protein
MSSSTKTALRQALKASSILLLLPILLLVCTILVITMVKTKEVNNMEVASVLKEVSWVSMTAPYAVNSLHLRSYNLLESTAQQCDSAATQTV